ncbi:MAG: hypothetical protein WCH40_10390 [Verrucomicrobiales bacterium]
MKTAVKLLLFSGLMLVGALAQAGTSKVLYFTSARGSNTVTLDHLLLNGKPKLNPIITQVYLGTYNAHFVGLRYDTAIGKWQAYNEDGTIVPSGSAFNILVPGTSSRVFATPANSFYDFTVTQTQAHNPDALLHCSHLYNPVPSAPGDPLNNGVGLYRHGTYPGDWKINNKWSVYNEDESRPKAVGFSVADVTKEKVNGVSNSFIFTVARTSYLQTITNSLTDGQPNARLVVTHLYGQLHNHPVGVLYSLGQWSILNEDLAPMVVGDKFIVSVYPATP